MRITPLNGKDVAVVGSGNTAFGDAAYLSSIAKSVTVLTKSYNKAGFSSHEMLAGKNNVKILTDAMSKKIEGKDFVESLTFVHENIEKTMPVSAVFVAIGRKPETEALNGVLQLTEKGNIVVDKAMKTSCQGVFACGDVTDGVLKQIVTAEGDGAIAATSAVQYLNTFSHS